MSARRKYTRTPGVLAYLERRLGSCMGNGPEYHFWCPMCIDRRGDESSSRKLAFNAGSNKFHCFRCGYGTSNIEQFFRTLNGGTLRIEEAIILKGEVTPPETGVTQAVREILYSREETRDLKAVKLPSGVYPLYDTSRNKLSRRPGLNYIINERGVHERLVEVFKVHYCPVGDYAHRLVFPVYQNGEQVYFVTRHIGKHPRKSKNPLNEDGFHTVGTCLLNYDNVVGAKVVAVVEGPLDCLAFKHAVSLGGKNISEIQAMLLEALVKFGTEEFVIALDADATRDAEKIYQALLGRVPKVSVLSFDYGDPDERRADLSELMAMRGVPSLLSKVQSRVSIKGSFTGGAKKRRKKS